MTLNAIRAALADRLETITGLRVHEAFPQQISPPAAFVGSMRRSPAQTFDGSHTTTWDLFICLGQVELARNVELLDEYADATGAKSVEAAFVASPTLGGTAYSAVVEEVEVPVTVEVGGQPYLAARFVVEVFA